MSHTHRNWLAAVGIDPDSNATGIAMARCYLASGLVAQMEQVEVIRVASACAEGMDARRRLPSMARAICQELEFFQAPDLIVVEGQNYRPDDPRPDNIVQVAAVEGIAAGAALQRFQGQTDRRIDLSIPLPVEWKGTIDKRDHQKKVLKRLDLPADLDGIEGASVIEKKDRIHVVDGIGLALWGLDELVKQEKKLRILR